LGGGGGKKKLKKKKGGGKNILNITNNKSEKFRGARLLGTPLVASLC